MTRLPKLATRDFGVVTASLIVSIIAALFALGSAYAAWRAVRPKPNLRGSVTSAWHIGVSYGDDGPAGVAILTHVIFTNSSVHPVHLLGYELHVKLNDGSWRETERLRSRTAFTLPELYLSNGEFVTELSAANLLDWPPKPVQYGAPLMGFLMFILPRVPEDVEVDAYRLVTADVFGNREEFTITSARAKAWQEGRGPFTVVELFEHAGAKVRPVAQIDRHRGERNAPATTEGGASGSPEEKSTSRTTSPG